MAELADAQDLKSCGPYRPYRFDSGLRHHNYRGVEQLVARRAHNPEVVGSSPSPATKSNTSEPALTQRTPSGDRLYNIHGGVAQLARAFGSYPNGRWFESDRRYH